MKSVGSAAGERVWGIRSMDDVVMVGTYTMGNSITRGRERREKETIERVEQLKYHDSMVLERTDDDTTDWQRYLEGEIRVHWERMEVRYFNANSVSLQGNGTCVRPKVQSGASYIL